MIRPATIHDVPRIQEIINSHAELGRMLFKGVAQLYESLRDFAVYEIDGTFQHASEESDSDRNRSGAAIIVGCAAMSILWADLGEIRSLAVDENYRFRGIGHRLVDWAIDEARRMQVRRVMALTYEKAFFEKLGFEVVDKDTLPLKVWSDCIKCPKRDGCDEIAMVKVLPDVPLMVMHPAPPTPRGVQIPVLPDVEESVLD